MSTRGWILSVLLSLLPWPAAAAMVHPGIVNNTAEYNLMRQKVSAGDDPWAAAYNAIPASVCSYTPTMPSSMTITQSAPGPAYPIRKDAIHAYAAALRWVIGGSTVCRDKAIQILNHMKVLTSITGENQRKLNISWYFPPAIYAAELMKHWPGSTWSASDQASWQSWVQTRLVPFFMGTAVPSTSTGANNNWAAYGQNVRSAWAVYTDNTTLLNTVKSDFRVLVEFYIGKFGKPQVFDGFTWETCRAGNSPNGGLAGGDVAHTAMFFNGVTAAAEIAAKQGDASLFSFLGAADHFGLRTSLMGHSPFFFWPQRAGSSNATWPCNLAINNDPNRPSSRGYNWMAAYNRYRDPIMLTLSNYQSNLPVLGENDFVGLPFDRLTHATSIDSEGPTEPPPPATPQTWHATTTGTDPACTAAAPCSIAQVMTKHAGGDTIKLGAGVYAFECNGCLKSGTPGQQTVLESATQAGSTITVGTRGVSVNPGLATLSGNTGITLWIRPDQHHITVRHVNCTTTGSGTNPCIQVSDTTATSSNSAEDILLENMDVQAPTRTGAEAAIRIRGDQGSERVTIRTSRIHRAGAAVTFGSTSAITDGIQLSGPGHVIEDSDIYDNFGSGINVGCSTCPSPSDDIIIRNTRIYGNQWHGIDVQNTTDVQVSHNLIYANGGAGLQALGSTKRSQLYNNSISDNSQIATSNAFGVYTANAATWIGRNNLITGHPLGPIFVGSLASQISCSNNLTDAASGSSLCSSWTLNAVPTNVWEDHDHATLASRDFRLKTGSAAIDNASAGICTTANANANLCTPTLTLTSFVGAAPDQGAIESGFTVPPPTPTGGQLIASYSFDTDFTDSTTFANHGTATSVTIDTTNKRAGAGAALFNASTDRITMPLNGVSLSSGLTVALSARLVTAGQHIYMFGHTATPPSYSSRMQIKKNVTDQLMSGLGGHSSSILTNFVMTIATTPTDFDRFVLRLTPGTTAGTGTGELWANGQLVGSSTYSGLTQLGTGATIGNNDGEQIDGWLGQIDEVKIWNYPLTLNEIATDCVTFCTQPTPPDEEFVLGSAEIGGAGDNVVTVQIESGADPARCTPLSDYQVTYGGVPQTETSCSITGVTNPILRVTSAANALPGQVVTLTYQAQDPIPVANTVQGGGSFDPLVLTSCTTDITGLSIICQTQGNPNANVCQSLQTDFVARDECAPVPLESCSMTSGPGGRILTLRRVSPPVDGATAIDVIYVPSDQRLAVTNLFDPTDPEIPPTTGLAQTQWRCRSDGLDSATPWKGRPNQLCEAPSPGGINIRLAIANTSGTAIPDFASSLFCSRQNVGGQYGSFMRVGPTFGTLGLRFGPQTTHGVPDGVLLPSAALPVDIVTYPGLTYAAIGGFRRQELQSARPTLGTNQQMEEEYALDTGPTAAALPIGTRFVCRAHDRVGNVLTAYTGVPGCSSDPAPFTGGEVPCGVPIVIGPPTRRGR